MTDTKPCLFCGEEIKAVAKKCRYCLEFLDGNSRESVWNEINTGGGAVVGNDVNAGSFVGRDQFNGPVTLGKDKRDEQYEIVLNWEKHGKPRLRNCNLARRNLSHLSLDEIDLSGSDLYKANLYMAKLKTADLEGVDLRGANLCSANLELAILYGAALQEADIKWANLFGATFQEADLRGANLSGAILKEADLREAKYDKHTIFPNNFDPVAAGAILVEDETP